MKIPGSSAQYKVHQWANDWITADTADGKRQNIVLNPLRVRLEGDEIELFKADYQAYLVDYPGDHHTGQFWRLWKLNDDGTFERRT